MDKDRINERFLTAVHTILSAKTVNKTAFANSLNITPSKFSEILNQRMKAGIDTIALLCYHYNVSTQWILLGIGDIFSLSDAGIKDKDLTHLINKVIEQAEEIGRLRQQLDTLRS